MTKIVVCVLLVVLLVGSLQSKNLDPKGVCRILTPLIKSGDASLARSISEVDSSHFLGLKSHSGFMTVNEKYGSNLFFWFFPAETPLETTPWVIWLQGGPGYSSMVGLFNLIGPLNVEDGEVKPRNITWTSDYSVLFLDNPVGAGFSFTNDEDGYPDNEDDVGAQMLEFLQQFLEMFPELRKAPLFVAGNSYAGKYVPALGIQIHRHKSEEQPYNLRGFMIGSGLIDPRSMLHYSQLVSALGLLEDKQVSVVKELEQTTASLIDAGKMIDASNKFNETVEYIKKHSGVSVYNYNNDGGSSGAPEFEAFLNRRDIRKLIGAGNATFDYNNQLVYDKMLPDIMNSTKPFLEELLEHYKVLCFHGQLDIIIAYSLALHSYNSLNWSRRQEYVDASREKVRLTEDGDIVAYTKSGGGFTEMLVRNAGHSVPEDQPEVAKYIADLFINTN